MVNTTYPLSRIQEQVFLRQSLSDNRSVYNISYLTEIRGSVDPSVFARVLQEIGKQVEVFRLEIVDGLEGPSQRIGTEPNWHLDIVDCSGEADPKAAMDVWIENDMNAARDLGNPLFTHCLFQASPQSFFWYCRGHHIACDGLAGTLVIQEVARGYSTGLESVAPIEWDLESFTYLLDQAEAYRESKRYQADRGYWEAQFVDRPPAVSLSRGFTKKSDHVLSHTELYCRDVTELVRTSAGQIGVSHPQLLAAIVAAYVSRISGKSDLTLGFPVSGRSGARALRAVGVAVNILPLRFRIHKGMTMTDLIKYSSQRLREALRHQSYRVEDLVKALNMGSLTDQGFFSILVNCVPRPGRLMFGSSEGICRILSYGPVDDFSIIFGGFESGEMELTFLANSGLYTSEEFEGHVARFSRFLKSALSYPEKPVEFVDTVSEIERHLLLRDWSGGRRDLTAEGPSALFEAQVDRTPHTPAIAYEEITVSYSELNVRANQLAHHLIARGVGPEDRVAVALPRVPDTVVAILAVLKAGAAYVPLDLDHPPERLAYQLQDCRPLCLVTYSSLGGCLDSGVPQLWLDGTRDSEAIGRSSTTNPNNKVRVRPLLPEHPAYVIYTSGSTGRPKGVVMPIVGLTNLLVWHANISSVPGRRVAQLSAITFDLSAHELFSALTTGKTLYLTPNELRRDPTRLADWLTRNEINELFSPNIVLHRVGEALAKNDGSPSEIQDVFQAGEALDGNMAFLRAPRAGCDFRVHNYYGPTETQAVTYYGVPKNVMGLIHTVPIGRPIWNTEAYILDRDLQVVPIGVTGELYIAGIQVARGYLNKPLLTAERFIANSFGQPGSRMYRTGDVARWRNDGNLEFLGRVDGQVKIRGVRVELGEIEALLLEYPAIVEAAVILRNHGQQDASLVAFLVPAANQSLCISDIRSHMSERLPFYMLPSSFQTLGELPLTTNGKVDRRALAARLPERGTYVAPRNRTEQMLAEIFREILLVDRVGAIDDFFDLGGHSLVATRLISRVRQIFKLELSLKAVFEGPTIAELAERIESLRQVGEGVALPPLAVQSKPDQLPLSFSQERLWFMEQLGSCGAAYNICVAIRVIGIFHIELVRKALIGVVRRHDSLRTRFDNRNGRPLQIVERNVEVTFEVQDLQLLVERDQRLAVDEIISEMATKRFDLSVAPLFRSKVLRLGPKEHVVVLVMHHIVSDGWSMGVLVEEISNFYAAYAGGREPEAKGLSLQYVDFALWQRSWLKGELLERLLKYWREELEGAPATLQLPTDWLRPAVQSFRGAQHAVVLPRKLSASLKELARAEGVTPFMLLLAGYQLLLSRWSGQEDILVGSPVANRTQEESEKLIGFFVNILVLRTKLSDVVSFRELLSQVRETSLNAYVHQDLPFEELVQAIQPDRDLSHNPIVQTVFTLQNAPMGELRLEGLQILTTNAGPVAARFDVELQLTETESEFRGQLIYATDLFESKTIERLVARFVQLLERVAIDSDVRLDEIEALLPHEREELLRWKGSSSPDGNVCVHELVREQVRLTPDATAIISGQERMSYRELDRRSDELARYLQHLGVRPDTIVGICLERSTDLIIGLLGILKAGGAYLSLDPSTPEDRVAFMLEDAAVPIVLSLTSLRHILPQNRKRIDVFIDDDWEEIVRSGSKVSLFNMATPASLAYIIYTSGSTGKPKGVLVEHRALGNYLNWAKERYLANGTHSNFALFTRSDFDLSVTATYLPLLGGSSIKVYSHDVPESLEELSQDVGIDSIKLTPAHLVALSEFDLAKTKIGNVVVGGEALKVELAKSVLQQLGGRATIYNEYGPTETTVGCTMFALRNVRQLDDRQSSVPIGYPIANTEVYVLERNLRMTSIGVGGELYVSGKGVARGYLNEPGLTANRFIANPFRSGERMYRTGDLARWRCDGDLEFLGRTDSQVKVRGFRVELGEIEAVLNRHTDVIEAAVVARVDQFSQKHLVAYFVGVPERSLETTELRDYLSRKLPQYMVPELFVRVDRMPLTVNGKIDHASLPDAEKVEKRTYRADNRTAVEQVLCAIVAKALDRSEIDPEDNFLRLGGDSICLIRLVSEVRRVFEVELPLRTAFEAPSIDELAARIEELQRERGGLKLPKLHPQARPAEIPLSFAQERLWIIEQIESLGGTYNVVHAVRLLGDLNVNAIEAALDRVVERHESLRTRFEDRDGRPVQIIEPRLKIAVELKDLSQNAELKRESAVQAVIREAGINPFDLTKAPLLRAELLRLKTDEHVAVLTMHHIVSDGWSMGVLVEEISNFYAAYAGGREPEAKGLSLQYVDFALWQRSWLKDNALGEQLGYWKKQLADSPAGLELPTDRPRPAVQSFRGALVPVALSPELSAGVNGLARSEGVTPFMLLLAAFQLLLSRWSNQDDIVVGSPIANRTRGETEGVIGFFVNMLALRTNINPRQSFRELLAQIRETTLNAYVHQDLPFERLVAALRPERDLSRHPIFQVNFVLQNTPIAELDLPGLRLVVVPPEVTTAKFDLNLSLNETRSGFQGTLVYATDLFCEGTIEQLLQRWANILSQVVDMPHCKIHEFDILSAEERRRFSTERSTGSGEVDVAEAARKLFGGAFKP